MFSVFAFLTDMTGHNLKRHGFRVLEEGGGGAGGREKVGRGGGREGDGKFANTCTHSGDQGMTR